MVLFHPVKSLTACMDSAECPEAPQRMFRVLFSLGLDAVRTRGVAIRPDVDVFHLPSPILIGTG